MGDWMPGIATTGRRMLIGRTALCATVATGVFLFDLYSAPGAATSVPYIALPLIGIWADKEGEVGIWTVVGIVLAVLGWFVGAVDPTAQHVFVNRVVAVAAIAATGLVVAQNRRVHRALLRQASRDSLTGLWNRRALEDRLDDQRERSERHGENLAVCLIDLDGFKPVNDRFGHAAGDALLQRIADRLRASVRRYETVARIGGDEFVVVLEGLDGPDDARLVAERLLVGLADAQQGLPYRVGASAGLALLPLHAEDPGALLQLADRAMYRAKARGGGVEVAPLPPAVAGAVAGEDDVQGSRSAGGTA